MCGCLHVCRSSLLTLLYLLSQGLLWTLNLLELTSLPRKSLVFASWDLGLQVPPTPAQFLLGIWGYRLWPLSLLSKHFLHWALAPYILFYSAMGHRSNCNYLCVCGVEGLTLDLMHALALSYNFSLARVLSTAQALWDHGWGTLVGAPQFSASYVILPLAPRVSPCGLSF